MKYIAVALIGCIVATTMAVITRSVAAAECTPNLPAKAAKLLAVTYPGYRVLQLADLNVDDRGLWKDHYRDACPGVANGNFTGVPDEYAVILVSARDHGSTKVILLQQPKESRGPIEKQMIYEERRVGNLPVVRRGGPGIYEDIAKHAKVKSSNDAVLIEHLESSVIAIVFTHSKPRVLRITD